MRTMLVLAALAVAAPLGGAPAPAEGQSPEGVTVYSSLPLNGAARPQAQAIVQGARLALVEAGGSGGGVPIRYVSLDDSTRRAGTWTPERVSANARRAAMDESTIAYLGEFNSGASAISIPIVNETGMAQISPSNTAVGLTRGGPGADRGEPEKYYPTGRRTFFRITPNDRVQGAALAAAMRLRGCRRFALLTDGELYGAGLGRLVRRAAPRAGLREVFAARIDPRSRSYRPLARQVRAARPGCVVFTGITANGAVPLFRYVGRALPRARLLASDGVAEAGFTDPRQGGVPARIGNRVVLTVSTLAPEALPVAGSALLARYSLAYGDTAPDPFALNGYESMQLVIDAVAAVGPDRARVVRWLRRVRNRASVLGTYSFDRYNDTTRRTYGTYRISDGELVWAGAVRAP